MNEIFLRQASSEEYWRERDFRVQGDTSLRERAARIGLIYGAAAGCHLLTSDRQFAASFVRECGMLVAESELKWAALRPSPHSFDFTRADCLARFAEQNGLLFRGTALLWHEALPHWFERFVHRQNAEDALREHLTTVVRRYAGRMHSWDVVNEAIFPWDRQAGAMRNTSWLKLIGPQYVDLAFRVAAEADPNALLMLNQNRLENESQGAEQCRAATLELLKRLKAARIPVGALGIQAHLRLNEGRFNPKRFKAFLKDVVNLDVKVMITELDVTDLDFPRDVISRDRAVAAEYEDFLSVVLAEPAVIGVVTWGLSDRSTWLTRHKPRDDGAAVRPLPLDDSHNRKLAWNAMARAFDKAIK